ncbi:helix-turn-helix domain-containing protein [Ferrimicrobium sp.]|uniref:helix-turn-helix domain-containing protein n=1 Tax=Ferrimicrobium sp. TaxID=2926050 RepID=UPI00262A7920|nr:helix-turn-helix domain-containing protein [Ferrimicrobium sp.]
MRKIEEILRLSAQGKSARAISRDTGVSRPSVAAYLEKAAEHEISGSSEISGNLGPKSTRNREAVQLSGGGWLE